MPKSVLVVDDEMLIALDIQNQLSEQGHIVHIASSKQDAICLLEKVSVDVAVVDGHLGGQYAVELAQLLRDKHIPYVVCSGATLSEVALLFEGAPFIPKPFLPEQLKSAIEEAIAKETAVH